MTSPPLGTGYPDAGVVGSLWGDPIVNLSAQTFANGATIATAYVGNWAQLQLVVNRHTNTPLLVITWYADAAFTQFLGSADITTSAASPQGVLLLANQGPYVAFTMETADLGTSNIDLLVVPAAQVSSSQMGFLTGAYTVTSSALASGVSSTSLNTTTRAGRAVLGVTMTGANSGEAHMHTTDFSAVVAVLGGLFLPASNIVGSSQIIVPPLPSDLTIHNSGPGASTMTATLTFDPQG